MISVIVPVYNEEGNVEELFRRIKEELEKTGRAFEILFVDDGSTDGTCGILKRMKPVKVIRLRKNFGQTSAMDAGFHEAKGEILITMDGDLQNDPSDIPVLIRKLEEGYDVVSGWRKERQDPYGRKVLSRLANWLTCRLSGLYLHDSACAMKAYKAEMLRDVHLYGEMHVFLPAYLHRLGAKVIEIPVRHHSRKSGVSKHYFAKALKNIADLLTIRFLTYYMSRPLIFFGICSIFFAVLGFFSALAATVLKVMELRNFGQTPLPMLAVFFVIIGFLLFMMGFLAELMVRIYWESQKRTPYIIREIVENK